MKAGISPRKISLSSQEFPLDFADLYPLGIEFNACSLHQLKRFGELFPGASCGIRFNPGVGSGGTEKTNVGGPSSSFGIWHDQVADVKEIASFHGINIKKIHTHIGSGSDPSVWTRAAGVCQKRFTYLYVTVVLSLLRSVCSPKLPSNYRAVTCNYRTVSHCSVSEPR